MIAIIAMAGGDAKAPFGEGVGSRNDCAMIACRRTSAAVGFA